MFEMKLTDKETGEVNTEILDRKMKFKMLDTGEVMEFWGSAETLKVFAECMADIAEIVE